MRFWILAILLVSAAQADIQMPGWKNVSHTMEVIGLEKAPAGTTFVLAPMHLGMGSTVVAPGVRFTFRAKYTQPHLYALKGGKPPESKEEVQRLLDSDAPRTDKPFEVTNSVREASPFSSIHTVYEFRGIEGSRIELRHVHTTRYNADGDVITDDEPEADGGGWRWPPLLLSAVALLVLVGLVLMRRGK